ncbi:MAG: hypothetical protein HY072_08450 [Deltaproteobacteria bacterium]|nr:hypothetical protein [Deltaproteobacteria bacterium]
MTNEETVTNEKVQTTNPTNTIEVVKKVVLSRRILRTLARQKRALKLKTDSGFAKVYFEAKSKRSAEKKSAYRKKKKGKK